MSKLMTQAFVVTAILVLSIVILITLSGEFNKLYGKIIEKYSCKDQILSISKLRLRYQDFERQIKCPTGHPEIKTTDEKIAKKQLADYMYDCWDQFDRGQPENLFADDNVYCHVCHIITLDKGVKINRFNSYLATESHIGEKMTYAQFLTTEKTENSQFLSELDKQQIDDSIDASVTDKYAIIFTYIKGKKHLEEHAKKAEYASPGAGAMVVGFGIVKAGTAIGFTGIGAPVGMTVASVGGLVMTTGALWTGISYYLTSIPFEHIASISLVPYEPQYIQNINCKVAT